MAAKIVKVAAARDMLRTAKNIIVNLFKDFIFYNADIQIIIS